MVSYEGLLLFTSKLCWTNREQGWLKAFDILDNSTEERWLFSAQ